MTQLLTTRSGIYDEDTTKYSPYPKFDYANSFFLYTEKESIIVQINSDGTQKTKNFNVLTIPCDGVVQYIPSGDVTGLLYYKYENPSPKYSVTYSDAGHFFHRIGFIPSNVTQLSGLPVSQGDKFICAGEFSESSESYILMTPYVGVDISFKTRLIYWDYPENTTIQGKTVTSIYTNEQTGQTTISKHTSGNVKLTTKAVSNDTTYNNLITPNTINVKFEKYRTDGHPTMPQPDIYTFILDSKCTFVGWYPEQRNNFEPLPEESLYENGKLKYSKLYAIYQTEDGKYIAAFDK